MVTFWLTLIATAALVAGLIGVVVPGLPGIPLVWLLLALDYWVLGYLGLNGSTMLWLTLVAVITLVIDYAATALGVKKRGGSTPGLIGSVAGLIIGLAVFNIPGMLIGCFIGAMLGELLKGHEAKQAAYIAVGALLGYATATAVKLVALVYYAVVIFYNIYA